MLFDLFLSLSLAANICLTAYILYLKKTPQKPPLQQSQELVDFIQDMKTHGYGVVRINPDNVFFRRPK